MMSCVLRMAVRRVRMMSCGFVIAGFMMFSSFAMVTCRVFVMLCCLCVVIRRFLGHFNLR